MIEKDKTTGCCRNRKFFKEALKDEIGKRPGWLSSG